MLESLLPILRCPECGPEASLRVEHRLGEDAEGELLEGVLGCPACGRWFRVEEGIADLVRDGLREVEDERGFLERWAGKLPAALLDEGRPYSLRGAPLPAPSEEDLRILEEGRHWGRFMQHFWDVGDRSIFDIRCKGSHPPFFVAGVLERDTLDVDRPYSNFPPRAGYLAFSNLKHWAGRWGVDVGCGGGQFGLEAAYQGVRMVGFDPSFGEVRLARRHAREQGLRNIDYVRAEPAHPPFARGVFALLMAKDSLHHVPDLPLVFERLLQHTQREAWCVVHEHVARARRKEALMARFSPPLIRKIRARYPKVEIPPELLRDSANEDVAAEDVRSVLHKHFLRAESTESLFLRRDMELLVHFAFGKRRWLSLPARWAAAALEGLLLALGDRQHVTFVGWRRT